MKKVLIFYARYGGGHLRAATSITEYIRLHVAGVEPVAIDVMAYRSKTIVKISTSASQEKIKNAHTRCGSC